jgi:hypothetical protein
VSGNSDDRYGGESISRPYFGGRSNSIHHRQAQIHQYDVRLFASRRLDGFLSIFSFSNQISEPLQFNPHEIA